jgi:hypothetical protein
MSKSHSDHLRIQDEAPLERERDENLRVLHAFVTDAIDDNHRLEHDDICALARRAYELGLRVGLRTLGLRDPLAHNLATRITPPIVEKGPRPYHVVIKSRQQGISAEVAAARAAKYENMRRLLDLPPTTAVRAEDVIWGDTSVDPRIAHGLYSANPSDARPAHIVSESDALSRAEEWAKASADLWDTFRRGSARYSGEDWKLDVAQLGVKSEPVFTGWDYGDRSFGVLMSVDDNGMVVHDIIEKAAAVVDEITGRRDEALKEPCPIERMEDEGGPPSGPREWDEFPKVGLAKPVDFLALNKLSSGG